MNRFTSAAILLLTFSTGAFADLIIEARETGGDVVFTTSGSLDLTGWTKTTGSASSYLIPIASQISFGAPLNSDAYYFGSTIEPSSFGTGGYIEPNSSSGGAFAFQYSALSLGTTVWVESGYQFGAPIEATMTFENATIDSLGINPGDTVWSWLAEPVAFDVTPASLAMESITLRAIAIPEPSAFAFLGLIGLVAGGRSWWRRR